MDFLNTRSSEENRLLVKVVDTPYEACDDAHAVAILTEWDEFKSYDWKKIKDQMKKPAFVFDGRKLLNRKQLEDLDFKYYAIGE
ncbi:UDP-glucose 6-dehydrogenase TuaD [compost metagenome]